MSALRVAACSSCSCFQLKDAKADQGNRVTGFENGFDGFD